MTSQSCGCGRSHVITFGLFSPHDKGVPVEERNGEAQPEEEQAAAPEEEGEGGEEEEGEAADEDEAVEEADEVTQRASSLTLRPWFS